MKAESPGREEDSSPEKSRKGWQGVNVRDSGQKQSTKC